MSNGYLTESLTYGELFEHIQNTGRENMSPEEARLLGSLDAPGGDFAGWQLTIRKDPHHKLLSAIYRVQDLRPSDAEGMRALRDVGDRQAAIMFAGYYSAVAKCVQMDGCTTAAEWQQAIEADTPEADALDDMIGMLATFYFLRMKDAQGKSEEPSQAATGGENNG